ncbi:MULTISPECIES: hypothetical protein [Geobacillus]|nr:MULTISPECIES: hypothetical protein [Geobacillus]WPZ17260.1 hypothetical protein UM396_11720 [Geobacillus subterraneus]
MTNRKQRTEDDERTSRNNWRLFFFLLAVSLLWGAAYWLWIAK